MFSEKKDLFYLYINANRNARLGIRETVYLLRFLIQSFIKDVARDLKSRRKLQVPDFKGKKLVFANSFNNYEALKFLLGKYPDAILITSGSFVAKSKLGLCIRQFLFPRLNFGKYCFIAYLLLHPRYRARHFERILRSYDFVQSYIKLFSNNRPECVFISNDHFPDSRAMMLACNHLHIPCFYLQHASVSSAFPPIRASHSLLYGKFSEDVYRAIGDVRGRLICVGNHKFDRYRDVIARKHATGRIGVAFNTLDSIDEVVRVCELLAAGFGPGRIILRAHPAVKHTLDNRYEVSPRSQTSLEFLTQVDVLVSGNSSILLEAASMNVFPIQVAFGNVPSHFVDYYGFIRTGVAREVKDHSSLVPVIKEVLASGKFNARASTRLYDASVGETFEFRVEEHIVAVVNDALKCT